MEKVTILMWFIMLTTCSFCGKDFESLGRHSWRCKSRMKTGNEANCTDNMFNSIDHYQLNYVESSNNAAFVCCCGKRCKGEKGLQIHQRTCKTIEGLAKKLNREILSELSNHDNYDLDDHGSNYNSTDIPVLKPGVKLPDSMSEWSTANLYFQTRLDLTKVSQENLDNSVNEMNDVIYKYFKENYGLVKGHNKQIKQLKRKYSGYSKNQLKRQLKRLKSCKDYGLSVEIKFLSRLIRSKISKANTTSVHNFDHDYEIQ